MNMSTDYKRSYVIIPAHENQHQWLKNVLSEEGEVIETNTSSVEHVTELFDLTGSQVLFVGMTKENSRQICLFIDELITLKPLLLVVAIADDSDSDLVLNAMRAGAKDFIITGSPKTDVKRQVERLQMKAPAAHHGQTQNAKVTSIINARPSGDVPMLALHLALAMQQDGENVLLIDLGMPAADCLLYLGMHATYTFVDALRSLRRLDATLIESAFAKHESGLKLLALPDNHLNLTDIPSADIFVILGVLKQHFSQIVINLGGVGYSNFLHLLVTNSDKNLLVLEQSVPSCKQNMELMKLLSQGSADMKKVKLIVDRYLPTLPPDAESLARGLDIELMTTLPSSGMSRLKMMNTGESMFECAPRDPYSNTVKKISRVVMSDENETVIKKNNKSWPSLINPFKKVFGG